MVNNAGNSVHDPENSTVHTGGCFCGAIRYEFTGDNLLVADCHCTMCRKTSGAPYVTWVIVPDDNFTFVKGQPKLLSSSAKGERFFCDQCGTPMTCSINDRPQHIDVTTGSLDHPDKFKPTVAVHEDNKLPHIP